MSTGADRVHALVCAIAHSVPYLSRTASRHAPSVAPWQFALVAILSLGSLALHAVSPIAAIWSALGLFLLGIPHGAVERHPTRRGRLRRTLPTLGYTALYLVVALLFFCAWLIDARLTLGVFLIISAVHFSASEPRLKSAGLWVVSGSLALWTGPTLDIFSTITARDLADAPLPTLAAIAALATGAVLAVEAVLRRDIFYGALLLVLFLAVPPVSAVAIYYFGVHSVREWRDVHAQTREGSSRPISDMVRLYAPFSLPVLVGGAGMIFATAGGYVPIAMAAGLGMAIAAPHMAPFEQWVAASRDTFPPDDMPDRPTAH